MKTHVEPIATQPVAQLVSIDKSYGAVRALNGLDLDLKRGEVLALLGPNGAGKTTAVSILLGLLDPDGGKVKVWGSHPRSLDVRARSGAMLQESGVARTLTVAELIDLHRSYYPRPASVESLLEATDLWDLMPRRVTALSGGQRQRLMFALALAGNPELLFLDEPSAGLDLESRHRLWAHVRQLAGKGCSVLLTTHHLEEADALADRIVVIDHGKVVAEGTPAELQDQVSGRLVRCVTRLDLEAVKALSGVRRAEMRGIATEIVASDGEQVVRQLLDLDDELRDLEVRGMGLEHAFLALTERAA